MTFHQLKQKHEALHKRKISDVGFARRLMKVLKKAPLTLKIARQMGRVNAHNPGAKHPFKITKENFGGIFKYVLAYSNSLEAEQKHIKDSLIPSTIASWQNGATVEQLAKNIGLSPVDFRTKWETICFVQEVMGNPLPNVLNKHVKPTIGNLADF